MCVHVICIHICLHDMYRLHVHIYVHHMYIYTHAWIYKKTHGTRGGGLGSRPKKMYGERLGDGVEYHLMKPTPRR